MNSNVFGATLIFDDNNNKQPCSDNVMRLLIDKCICIDKYYASPALIFPPPSQLGPAPLYIHSARRAVGRSNTRRHLTPIPGT